MNLCKQCHVADRIYPEVVGDLGIFLPLYSPAVAIGISKSELFQFEAAGQSVKMYDCGIRERPRSNDKPMQALRRGNFRLSGRGVSVNHARFFAIALPETVSWETAASGRSIIYFDTFVF